MSNSVMVDIYESTKKNKYVIIPAGSDIESYNFNDPDLDVVTTFKKNLKMENSSIIVSAKVLIDAFNSDGYYISNPIIKFKEN